MTESDAVVAAVVVVLLIVVALTGGSRHPYPPDKDPVRPE